MDVKDMKYRRNAIKLLLINNSQDSPMDNKIVLIILAIFLPPIAVF